MESSSENRHRFPTPPDCPYYNVHVSESEAQQILACPIPEAIFLGLTTLPDGTYYNNRVYKIQYRRQAGFKSETNIFKVCGLASGRAKPRNEVHVLRLIEATRPFLPVPRVIAWSGQKENAETIIEHSWILLTLLEGQSLDTVLDADEADRRSVFEDVAGFLTDLRMSFPSSIGMRSIADSRDENKIAVLGAPVDVPTLLGWPKKTYLEYTTALLEEGLALRRTDSDYAEEQDLLPLLSTFIDHALPHLPMFRNDMLNTTSVLTNCDISAQNILVTRPVRELDGQNDIPLESIRPPLRLSGIVDWEYAGFFSPVEEFLTASPEIFDLVPHHEDGIGSDYARYLLPALTYHGQDTPHSGRIAKSWQEVQLLHQLREYVVPWWVRGLGDTQRAATVKEASRLFRSIIDQLSKKV